MGVLSNKIEREKLKPGDHIYSWRHAYIYAHHGIYVGEGNVIHFTRGRDQEIGTGTGTVLDRIMIPGSATDPMDIPCSSCGDQSNLYGVITSCIDCFLSGGNLYLFEYGVTRLFFLARVRGGLLVFSSIGVGGSGQASSFRAAAKAASSYSLRYLTTSFSGLTVVGFGMYCAGRLNSDIGVRRDVQKVPVEILVEMFKRG